jgi:Flp pilus assembly protein CpaB
MKWTVALLVVVGLAAALCAAVLTAGLRSGWTLSRGAAVEEVREVEILVAAHSMPAMKVVDGSGVARRTVMSNELAENAMTDLTNVIGKVLVAPVVDGEAFTTRHFATNESGLNLASALPEGYRAMSTVLTTDAGIESLLYPGCVVDVIASFRLPAVQGRPSGEVLSATLLQGVQVLAIGPRSIVNGEEGEVSADAVGVDRKRQRMVTLMVDADQAEALQLANAYGDLTITLRNPLDTTRQRSRGMVLSDLSEEIAARLSALNQVASAAPMFAPEFDDEGSGQDAIEPAMHPAPARREEPAPKAQAYWTTTVIRAGKSETLTFEVP